MSDHLKRFAIFFVLGCWVIAICHCDDGSRSLFSEGMDFKKLLEAARSTEVARSLDVSQFKYQNPKKIPKRLLPDWPIYSFLLGEVYRLRGDTAQAKKLYQGLVQWAATDPYADGWGASGLVSLALWRWLEIINTTSNLDPREGEHLLEIEMKLWNTRLFQGMFQSIDIFGALPQLKEEILRGLISLAWSIGKKQLAQQFFVEYLTVSRTAELSPDETKLLEESESSGVLSRGQVALFRGERLEFLGNYDGSFQWLNQAWKSDNAQVRAEASLHLARLRRIKGEKCATPAILELLSIAINESADPDVVQEALFYRAIISIREGCPQNYAQFKIDLNRLIEDFPLGRRTDDALNELASYYLYLYWRNGNESDLEQALRLFKQLRNFKGENDFFDSSLFKPAIALYSRGKSGDTQIAASLLQELENERPLGPLHLPAQFWLGRLAAESGEVERSKEYFRGIIDENPYSYYAIRARVHLSLGNQASQELLIDSVTKDELRKAYHASKNATSISNTFSGTSPYHLRLKQSLASNIYLMAIDGYSSLRRELRPSQRLENVSLKMLGEKNKLLDVALLLALRQDALAAVDLTSDSANRLEIAGTIGQFTKDWPLVIFITGASDKPYEIKAATRRDTRYLSIAYPMAFKEEIEKYSSKYKLPAEFIYGIIREESAFYPEALSLAGALGLFQFTPATFQKLNEKWKLLENHKKSSKDDFLLDPELSIYLGARWFREELMRDEKGNLLFALMEHIAGYGALKEWRESWVRVGRANDYEYMLETARHGAVGPFVRSVLSTFWIIQGAGIYKAN